jgi:hypothetical protein
MMLINQLMIKFNNSNFEKNIYFSKLLHSKEREDVEFLRYSSFHERSKFTHYK